MAGIGHITSRRSVHCHEWSIACPAGVLANAACCDALHEPCRVCGSAILCRRTIIDATIGTKECAGVSVPSGISLYSNEREGAEKWPSHVRNFRSKIRKSTGIRTNFRKVSLFAYKLSQYTKGTFPEWWHKSGWFLRWGCQATRELLTEAKRTR